MNTIPTPRTDACEQELHHTFQGGVMRKCAGGGWVDADFCRTLERELAEMSAESQRNREAAVKWSSDFYHAMKERDQLHARVAALETAKTGQ